MAELIYVQDNGKLAFGDYTLAAKAKADGFLFGGEACRQANADLYRCVHA